MPSKKVKVNSSESSSIKTQSSSGSTRLHLTPARKSNRLQKSSFQLPEFSPRSVSPKKSATRESPGIFDPRAIAVNPTRKDSSIRTQSSGLDLTSVRKSSRLQRGTPKEEKLSAVFACTPVKEDDDDQDKTDDDSESRQTVKENRGAIQYT